MNKNAIIHQPLSNFTDVQHFVNGENLHIVKINEDSFVKELVMSKENLDKLISSSESLQTPLEIIIEPNPLMLIKTQYLIDLVKYGRTHYFWRDLGIDLPVQDKDVASKNLLEDASNKEYEFVQYVPNERVSQVWMNADGKIYMEPLFLSGSCAQLNDATYFLDEFVEHLSNRDDIAFLTYTGRFSDKKPGILYCPIKGDEEGIGGVICDISHNLEENETAPEEKEEVQIVYYPKPEHIPKILEWKIDVDGRSPENYKKQTFYIDRFVIKEIFGGQAFLKNPPELINEEAVRKFKH